MSQQQADEIAAELQRAFPVGGGSIIDRSAIRNVMGGLRRKTLLGPQVD
jgi:hypothetical protein